VTATQGGDQDPDGFVLLINDSTELQLGASDTLTLEDLAPAEYRLTLSGVADNCVLSGQNPVTSVVIARLLTTVRFEIDCLASTGPIGGLQVIVATSGADPDEDGYLVHLDASAPIPTGINDTISFIGLPAGLHDLRLGGLANHCTLDSTNPRALTILGGDILQTLFEVRCWPPLSGRIAVARRSDAFFSEIQVINTSQSSRETFFSGSQEASRPSWSPDGARVAYLGISDDFSATTWVNLEPDEPIRLEDCDLAARRPVWSPDGRRILCLRSSQLVTVDVETQATQVLTPNFSGILSASWSSTGPIAFRMPASSLPGRDSIFEIASPGSDPAPLFEIGSMEFGDIDGAPAWSPDGKQLAVSVDIPNPDLGGPTFSEIHVLDLATRAQQVVFREQTFVSDLQWSPTGEYLLFTQRPPSGSERAVMRLRPDGQDLRQLVLGFDPSWSPDGSRIVFSQFVERTVDEFASIFRTVFAMHSDGTGIIQMTTGRDASEPAWSR
jgi:Tol biopolymer transport system component